MTEQNYEFTTDWFSGREQSWQAVFERFIPNAKKILEIGSFEGRSTVWLAENGLPKGGELVCIDTWQGAPDIDPAVMPAAEARFDRNIAKAQAKNPAVKIHKIKGPSRLALHELTTKGHGGSFDYIYVDGSHQPPDVLTDLVLSFPLCRTNGVIGCDDYLWRGPQFLYAPKLAIDAFLNCFNNKVSAISGVPLYQLFMVKVSD